MEQVKKMTELDRLIDLMPSEEEVAKRQRKHAIQQRMEVLEGIMPLAFQETLVQKLPQEQYKSALKWAKLPMEMELNLCLAGTTGVGKTRTAWEAIKTRYTENGGRPLAIGAETFTRRLFREPDLMAKLCNVRLLLLDDLGKEKTTPTAESAIFELVRDRMDNKLPTVYTTNFSPKSLLERFQQRETGEAVARRLKESSHTVIY